MKHPSQAPDGIYFSECPLAGVSALQLKAGTGDGG